MELNEQQLAVVNWAVHGKGSLNLVARAGCGKTTTLIEVVERIRDAFPHSSTFLGAFNKSIAAEIRAKLTARSIDWRQAEAGTMHSAGFRLWRGAARNVQVNERKVQDIITRLAEGQPDDSPFVRAPAELRAVVSLAKQSGFGWRKSVRDEGEWLAMIEHHAIELDGGLDLQRFLEAAMRVLCTSHVEDKSEIDYDDMVSAPLVHNTGVRYPYDFVLIDEAQDTNAARRDLALKLLRPGTGRLIAVGDDRQAIYGFTGADSDAMQLIKRALNSAELPLNITYRCPKAIVRAAQAYVPDIHAHETAPEGVVRRTTAAEVDFSQHAASAILCRNVAPLIQMAYELIARKIACRVEGRDIGKSLKQLANRWRVKTLPALRERLEKHLEKETAKWLAKGREDKVAALEDKVHSLYALMEACAAEGRTQVADLLAMVDSLFSDAGLADSHRVLTLSTVHKSKGREWPTVFILREKEFMPSRWARKEWQTLQEQNLIYVAITRAQRELVYLD